MLKLSGGGKRGLIVIYIQHDQMLVLKVIVIAFIIQLYSYNINV